jgi:ankyrin repeat protein
VLLINGAKTAINARYSYGFQTTLYNAAGRVELDIINALIDAIEASVAVNVNNKYNGMPLHEAARNEHLAVVQVLLKTGVDMNARYYDNQTHLHWAIKHGRLAIVKELLASGANRNAKPRMAKCH